MLGAILTLIFISTLAIVLVIGSMFKVEERPKLRSLKQEILFTEQKKKPSSPLRVLALINRPLCVGPIGRRMAKDLAIAKIDLSPEEFFLIKEAIIGLLLLLTFPKDNPDWLFFWMTICLVVGYMLPEIWLKKKAKKIKESIIKELPDTIDLLALCVNAGLDFMLALKWVVEKAKSSVIVDELNLVMQEINVGKARRSALSDLSKKYDIPDLSTFTRTLIQADRMGTSVSEALSMLSEDMRIARYRRGEQIALKAPIKMLVPLLFFVFPVVGILVGAPIMLEFSQNNPLQQIGGGAQPGR